LQGKGGKAQEIGDLKKNNLREDTLQFEKKVESSFPQMKMKDCCNMKNTGKKGF
jgi:hypothetical protein